jgi:hypothetical protein
VRHHERVAGVWRTHEAGSAFRLGAVRGDRISERRREGAADTPNLFALMSDGSDHTIAAVKGGTAVSILERAEDQAVQPQLTEVMRRALQKARDVLQLDGRPDDAMTDVIATKIIELAKAGEIDPDRLCSQVVIELADRLSDAER